MRPPATGVASFNRFGNPALNNSGQTAFFGNLTGTGVNGSNNSGIWSESGGTGLALIARAGDEAPGTGGASFDGFGAFALVLNNGGQTAFIGSLTGTGVNGSSDLGVWSEKEGVGLALVARAGDPAPDTGGVNFSNFTNLILNDAGQIAFRGEGTGTGVGSGIWAEDPSGVLRLIARSGDLLDVDDGPGTDFRTIRFLNFIGDSGNGDGRPSGFNNLGQLAFSASFTDGTSGIFVSNLVAIPEPATWVLAALAALGLFVRRW